MDFYKFWQILESNKLNEWDPNEPDEGPDPIEYPRACGQRDFQSSLKFRNGVFHDVKTNKSWPPISFPKLQEIIGDPEDTYTMDSTIYVCSDYNPGYDYGGGDAYGPELHGDARLEIEFFEIKNDKTKKALDDIPISFVEDKIIGIQDNVVYKVEYDLNKGKLEVWVN